MNQKTYPKAVVLKKGLIGVALVSAIFILVLIIHNLYQATNNQRATQMAVSNKIESVASQTDTK